MLQRGWVAVFRLNGEVGARCHSSEALVAGCERFYLAGWTSGFSSGLDQRALVANGCRVTG